MHAVVVLCLSAAILGTCKAAVLPAEETDLELTADDTDSGNWTANLGDMEVNIEHKHGERAQNSSGYWTMDISRIKFQKQDNSDADDSHDVEIEKSSAAPSEQLSNNDDAENQISNNEIDNDIPVDDFKTKDYDSYFPQPQMPLLRPELRLPQLDIMLKPPFQTWLYGRPNYLYEMLPPKEEIMINTPLYPLEDDGQDLEIATPKEGTMISTHYLTDEQSEGSEVMLPEVDLLTLPPRYQDESGQYFMPHFENTKEGSADQFQQTEYHPPLGLLPDPQIQSHESEDESEETDEVVEDPDGFEYFKGVGWFKLDPSHKNWEGARDACAAVGSHLAVPDTKERVQVFLKLFQRHPNIPAASILRNQAYIGVNDPEQKRQFTTVQGKPFNPGFPIWFVNEPDNADPGESCVTFHIEGRTRDVPCFYSLPFFCEKDIPVVI
ncbi:uncharacterized protein [Periplaneta americana]|uniref:uncharacterized protein n=1 Tax=Periplaneta americana TaxID=6978 RepID=UPI0037E8D38F